MPGNDLRCGLLENARSDVVRPDTAQLGVVDDQRVGAVSKQPSTPAESAAALASDGTCALFGSAPAASAKITVIWFQVSTSSEVIWKASPIVRVLPSRGTKPFAKSSQCVSVHSDVPSPCTTPFLPATG